jgi:hypothetical protein
MQKYTHARPKIAVVIAWFEKHPKHEVCAFDLAAEVGINYTNVYSTLHDLHRRRYLSRRKAHVGHHNALCYVYRLFDAALEPGPLPAPIFTLQEYSLLLHGVIPYLRDPRTAIAQRAKGLVEKLHARMKREGN